MYLQKVKDSSSGEQNDDEWHEITSFNKVKYFIINKENEEPGSIFEVKELEDMYIDLLQGNGITVKSHVSRFAEKLKSNIHGLETRNIGKKLAVYFTSTANILISAKIMTTSEIGQSMLDVVCMLRKEMN